MQKIVVDLGFEDSGEEQKEEENEFMENKKDEYVNEKEKGFFYTLVYNTPALIYTINHAIKA